MSYKEHKGYTIPLKDNMGRYRTSSLFLETRVDGFIPVFNLKDYDYRDTYSLKNIYMSYDHVPNLEYDFAIDVFGSWDHFKKLEKSVLRECLKEWRTELEIRNTTRAMKNIIAIARQDSATGLAASKFITERGYSSKRGRPSKEEVDRERKIASGVEEDIRDDMERLQLKVVK